MQRQLIPYARVRDLIMQADLLLYRRRGPIAVAGRGEWCHAAKAVWAGDVLMVCEVRGFVGGRAVTLSSQVRRRPGQIDVFAVNPSGRFPKYRGWAAASYMLRLAGTDYGWLSVIRAGLFHLPFVRCFLKPDLDDEAATRRPPYCSQACAIADRVHGQVDPVPNLADRLTEPSDLARSKLYLYRFTLIPDAKT